MRYLFAALMLLAVPAHAQQFNLQQLQNAVMSNPQVQQAVAQQAMQTAAANPAALAGGFATMTPAQSQQFAAQAQAVVTKLLTPAEQTKLTAFSSSPEGQSIAAKLPAIAQALTPIVMQAYMGNTGVVAPAAGAKASRQSPAFQPLQQQLPLTQPTGGK